jgi:glycosyltransferase involved in cell wall biosynthesis
MVLNATKEDISNYFSEGNIPSNLTLFPTQKDLDPFYRRASLLLNLTNPQLCVETFGMTILEAMCYGIPVIAPPVGGPAEIVDSGKNGFTIDVREEANLDFAIEKLYADGNMLSSFSSKAKETSSRFSTHDLQGEIVKIISLM